MSEDDFRRPGRPWITAGSLSALPTGNTLGARFDVFPTRSLVVVTAYGSTEVTEHSTNKQTLNEIKTKALTVFCKKLK